MWLPRARHYKWNRCEPNSRNIFPRSVTLPAGFVLDSKSGTSCSTIRFSPSTIISKSTIACGICPRATTNAGGSLLSGPPHGGGKEIKAELVILKPNLTRLKASLHQQGPQVAFVVIHLVIVHLDFGA